MTMILSQKFASQPFQCPLCGADGLNVNPDMKIFKTDQGIFYEIHEGCAFCEEEIIVRLLVIGVRKAKEQAKP